MTPRTITAAWNIVNITVGTSFGSLHKCRSFGLPFGLDLSFSHQRKTKAFQPLGILTYLASTLYGSDDSLLSHVT